MDAPFTFWFVVLAGLLFYLGVSISIRCRASARAEDERFREIEAKYAGKAIEASELAPQVRTIRKDYSARRHGRHRPNYQSELLAAARRFVAGFAFFRDTTRGNEE